MNCFRGWRTFPRGYGPRTTSYRIGEPESAASQQRNRQFLHEKYATPYTCPDVPHEGVPCKIRAMARPLIRLSFTPTPTTTRGRM